MTSMLGYAGGIHFDRFGDVQISTNGLDYKHIINEFDVKILKLQGKFKSDAEQTASTNNDNIKIQVAKINSDLEGCKKITTPFDIFDLKDNKIHGSLQVKQNRRISKVSRGTSPYDVVIKAQLDKGIKTLDTKLSSLADNLGRHKTLSNDKFDKIACTLAIKVFK